jgi:dihydroneopterin aldolase/2-amino-4-hydroxy-6-hydroxymethyldihydropteridine diphosphokinase
VAEADRIRLTGIRATGYHGVLDHERRDGQVFVADVVLHVDTREAAAADRLEATVDYSALAAEVRDVLAGEPADLIETVAERIAAVALDRPAVAAVDVVLHKPEAPVGVPVTDVAVEVHRSRVHLPAVPVPGPRGADPAPAPAAPVVVEPVAPTVVAPAPPAPEPVAERGATHVAPPAAPLSQAAPLTPQVAQPVMVPVSGSVAVPVWEPVMGRPAGGVGQVPDPGPVPPPPAADPLDAVPDAPVDVVLALGSNLGSSQAILRHAVSDLDALAGLEVVTVAPLARTAAVGGPTQADYLNTVVLARTTLSPRALLRACQGLEAAAGRERTERWGPRTLDIDIVMYGSTLAVSDDLELPHPRAHERAFVLEPWAQVDPGAVLPGLGGGPVAALATTAPDREGIRWLALDWWGPSEGT